jgi:hypothetical protein
MAIALSFSYCASTGCGNSSSDDPKIKDKPPSQLQNLEKKTPAGGAGTTSE